MKILVINGPNMNMLGIREPDIYGRETYKTLCDEISRYCSIKGVECELYHSNHEGDIVDKIQSAYNNADGIIINPAAYTHTSIAIADAIKAVGVSTVEVHISNPDSREDCRRVNHIRECVTASVCGKGIKGYLEAVDILINAVK